MAFDHEPPDAPGVWMNFDNTVSVRYDVGADESFDAAAQGLFDLLKDAEAQFPGWPRVLYLAIDGHLDKLGRFDPDMVELQQEFLFSVIGPFTTAVDTPLVSALNPAPQRNDFPDRLVLSATGGSPKWVVRRSWFEART